MVRDYGAVGDNRTDNTAAFLRAFADVQTVGCKLSRVVEQVLAAHVASAQLRIHMNALRLLLP
jgi:hypothetical protein